MRFASVCSGIEAASVAWEPLGWSPAWLSEIDPFPNAVLAHRFPQVPNYGDFTAITDDPAHAAHGERIELLVGGTPCQAFSVAGLRGGYSDPRGRLTLEFLRLARVLQPRWLVWENVDGVRSSGDGRDFGAFLAGLGQIGYGWAYRVLDAQYVRVDGYPGAVPQRRKRVFVVGHLGADWRRAAAVLFEPEGVHGHPAPRRAKKESPARAATPDAAGEGQGVTPTSCFWDGSQVTQTLDAVLHKGQTMPEKNRFPAVLQATYEAPAIGAFVNSEVAGTLTKHTGAGAGETQNAAFVGEAMELRRLTPRECERLMGFPDDWTLVPWKGKTAHDGGRYKALGNSIAVNCLRWVGRRIELVDKTWGVP